MTSETPDTRHNATKRAAERREAIERTVARNHAAGLHRPPVESCKACETPDTPSTDPDDCPQCGEQRDAPWADCAACGYIQPTACGDPSGRCLYREAHPGRPHKVAIRETPDTPSTYGPDDWAPGSRRDEWNQHVAANETPDTPSTEARPHDPFCVLFGINDLMQGRESGCTCATRRSDTPSTEALTPEQVAFQRGRDSLRGTLHVWRGLCGHVWDRRDEDTDDCPRCAERAVRQEAAEPSFVDEAMVAASGGIVGIVRQEAADTSELRAVAESLAKRQDAYEARGIVTCWLCKRMPHEPDCEVGMARAALRGATERPLDVPDFGDVEMRAGASPDTTPRSPTTTEEG